MHFHCDPSGPCGEGKWESGRTPCKVLEYLSPTVNILPVFFFSFYQTNSPQHFIVLKKKSYYPPPFPPGLYIFISVSLLSEYMQVK